MPFCLRGPTRRQVCRRMRCTYRRHTSAHRTSGSTAWRSCFPTDPHCVHRCSLSGNHWSSIGFLRVSGRSHVAVPVTVYVSPCSVPIPVPHLQFPVPRFEPFVSLVPIPEMYRNMYKCAETCRNMQKHAEMYRDMQKYTEIRRNILKHTKMCRNMLEYAETCRNMQKYAEIYRNMQQYAEICRDMQDSAGISRNM